MSSMLPIVIDSDDEVTVEKEDGVQLTVQEELMSSADRVCAAILNKDVSGELLLYGLQFEMDEAAKALGLAQFLDISIKPEIPMILSEAAAALRVTGDDDGVISRLRLLAKNYSNAHPPSSETVFENTWWLDKDGYLFIPRSYENTKHFRQKVIKETTQLQKLYENIRETDATTYHKHGEDLTEVSDAVSSFRAAMNKFKMGGGQS